MKDENYVIVSTDAEEACDRKVQHAFVIKILNSLEIEELCEHNKGRIWKAHS